MDKRSKKIAREKANRLKLVFHYMYKKMKNVIRRIFTSVIMPRYFIHFRPKIGFKSALGSFI